MGGAYNISLAKVHGSVIFAPAGRLVPEALRVLERGGTVALAGVAMMPLPELGYGQRLYKERGIRSVANFAGQDADELLPVAAGSQFESLCRLSRWRQSTRRSWCSGGARLMGPGC